MASLRAVTEDAMRIIGPDSERAGRVRAANAFFTWLSDVFALGRGRGRTARPGRLRVLVSLRCNLCEGQTLALR